MDFIEEGNFVTYRVEYKDHLNRQEIAQMTLDRLESLKFNSMREEDIPKRRREITVDKNGLHVDTFSYHSFSIYRDRVSSNTPFTIGLGQNTLGLRHTRTLNDDQISYLDVLRARNYTNRLANVVLSDTETTRKTVYKIIQTLSSNRELLEAFYREYQPDFIALRELLPFIELRALGRIPFEEKKEEIDALSKERDRIASKIKLNSAHPRTSLSSYPNAIQRIEALDTKIGTWPQDLALASENTEVAKTLNLEFAKVKK